MTKVAQNYDKILIRLIGSVLLSFALGLPILVVIQSFVSLSVLDRAIASQIQFYLLPGLIFTFWHLKGSWIGWYGLKEITTLSNYLVLAALLIAAYPIVQFLWRAVLLMELPDWIIADHVEKQNLTLEVLTLLAPTGWIGIIAVLGLLPAICEEWIYRGIILKSLYHPLRSDWVAIGLSALVFAAMHGDWIGFLPRVYLGIILGISYHVGKNIGVPIVLHALYNIGSIFLYNVPIKEISKIDPTVPVILPGWLLLCSVVVSIFCFVLLERKMRRPALLIQNEMDTSSDSDSREQR